MVFPKFSCVISQHRQQQPFKINAESQKSIQNRKHQSMSACRPSKTVIYLKPILIKLSGNRR